MRFGDVPTFDVADRSRPVATVRGRAQANLNESDYFSARVFGNEVDERHDPGRLPRQNRHEFFFVMLNRRIRPQRMPHSTKHFAIGWRCRADLHFCRHDKLHHFFLLGSSTSKGFSPTPENS